MSCSNILKIERKIALYKNNEKTYTILLFDQFKNLCDEFTLRKLPNLSEAALDVLFSLDIVEQDDDYIA